MGNPTRTYIKQWLYAQAIAGLVIAVALCIIKRELGWSCAAGSISILLANGYQGLRVALTRQQFNPVELLKNFYKGELGKFLILAVFVLVFARFVNLSWWAFIIGILGAQLGGAILLLRMKGSM
jgi:F0F1-type ATP synthase assembly protein I